jgi:hypothetical protein
MERWFIPDGTPTHTLMDGGKLFVSEDERSDFIKVYISEIRSGRKLYVVEQKTDPFFNFFVDLDYKASEKLSEDNLVLIVSWLHSSIGSPGRCCVARARPRPEKGLTKSGIHIVWPDVQVTRQQAMAHRTNMLMSLPESAEPDSFWDSQNWASVLDTSVYGGSGLRMIWSHKRPAGDPYIPWRMLVGTTWTELSKEPTEETLELFSVRCQGGKVPLEEPADAPSAEPIEEFIRRYLPGQKDASVKKIQRMSEGNSWYVQTDSKYCSKIRAEHRSNHVWFLIHGGRIHQRCFNEECKDFAGPEHILPPSILDGITVVGTPPRCGILDLFPEGRGCKIPELRERSPSIFGSRSEELGTLSI